MNSEMVNAVVGVAVSVLSGCMTINQDQVAVKNPLRQEANYHQAEDIGFRTAVEFFQHRSVSPHNREVGKQAYTALQFIIDEDVSIPADIEEYVIKILRERVYDDEVYADATILIRTSARRLKTRASWQRLSAEGRFTCLRAFNNGIKIAIDTQF